MPPTHFQYPGCEFRLRLSTLNINHASEMVDFIQHTTWIFSTWLSTRNGYRQGHYGAYKLLGEEIESMPACAPREPSPGPHVLHASDAWVACSLSSWLSPIAKATYSLTVVGLCRAGPGCLLTTQCAGYHCNSALVTMRSSSLSR